MENENEKGKRGEIRPKQAAALEFPNLI